MPQENIMNREIKMQVKKNQGIKEEVEEQIKRLCM